MRRSAILLLGGLILGFLAPVQAQNDPTPIRLVHERAESGDLVTVRGEIVRQLGRRAYLVADGTGDIRVSINADLHRQRESWVGVQVEVLGEVRTRRGRARLQAQRVVVRASDAEAPAGPEGESEQAQTGAEPAAGGGTPGAASERAENEEG